MHKNPLTMQIFLRNSMQFNKKKCTIEFLYLNYVMFLFHLQLIFIIYCHLNLTYRNFYLRSLKFELLDSWIKSKKYRQIFQGDYSRNVGEIS